MKLSELREDVENLTSALTWARYLAASGQTAALDLQRLFRESPHVATWEAFGLVREELGRSEGKRAGRLKVLLSHMYRLIEDATTAGAVAGRHAVEVATVPGTEPGESVPVRVALEEVALVGDREKRSLFERRAVDALAAGHTAMSRELETLQSVAQKAGHASPSAAHASLAGIELAALVSEAEAFLAATAAMYEDVLSWWMRRITGLRLFPHGAERHDLLHALALVPQEGLFPRGDSVTALAGNLSSMGLSPRADGRIRVDAERRVTKTPRPFVAPIDPPNDVIATYRPRRGYVGTRDFLFSLGAAQHYAHIEEARPMEDRRLDDRAVPLAIGYLFSQWVFDKRWLKRVIDAELPDLVRILGLTELARLRLLAAQFLHSLQVDREGPTAGRAKQYAERLSAAMLVAWPDGLWLYDTDVRLGYGDTLRARMLAIAWSEHLRERFDEDWWRNPQSGPYLKKAFSQGQQEAASVLAERLGTGPLSLGRAGRWLEELLNAPS